MELISQSTEQSINQSTKQPSNQADRQAGRQAGKPSHQEKHASHRDTAYVPPSPPSPLPSPPPPDAQNTEKQGSAAPPIELGQIEPSTAPQRTTLHGIAHATSQRRLPCHAMPSHPMPCRTGGRHARTYSRLGTLSASQSLSHFARSHSPLPRLRFAARGA